MQNGRATASNSGDPVKPSIPRRHGDIAAGQEKRLGYGKNLMDDSQDEIGNPQLSIYYIRYGFNDWTELGLMQLH